MNNPETNRKWVNALTDDELEGVVQCVVLHQELVEALRTLTFNADMATHFIPHVLLQEAVKKAKEALAKAGAK